MYFIYCTLRIQNNSTIIQTVNFKTHVKSVQINDLFNWNLIILCFNIQDSMFKHVTCEITHL